MNETNERTNEAKTVTAIPLTPTQQRVIDQIRSLREHTRLTGFKTSKSQSALKAGLNATDLAAVCAVLNADK